MSYDGNGVYNLPQPAYPAVPNTVIESAKYNEVLEDLQGALSIAWPRDGQAAATGNMPLGGHKLTGVANGTNPQDATTVLQVFTDPAFTATTVAGVKVTGTAMNVDVATLKIDGDATALSGVTLAATYSGAATFASTSLDLTVPTVTVTGLSVDFAVTTVTLPADTSIGATTAVELAYLQGLTGPVQTLLDEKANLDGGNTFTGLQTMQAALTAGSTAVTPASSSDNTLVATTAFVQQVAMNAALPSQTGNENKFLQTNGTDASWQYNSPDVPLMALGVI